MHEDRHDWLGELAAAVADGRVLDWDAIESSALSDEDRVSIRRLRAIAAIGVAHSELTFSDTASESLSVRSQLQGVEDSSTPPTWGSLRILERVGRGRFGDVYRAWDPSLDREVALKLLRRRDGANSDREVIEEGRLMARVRHPNVVTIHGAQRIEGRTGLWMEFVDGRTLESELAERGPFPAEEVVRVGIELCQALAAVHEAGLVHRDVKAQNVLRDRRGRILLGDFGTGDELDDKGVGSTAIAGTPVYLAPEIFNGSAATPRSDTYSLGVLLFHLATGSYPVAGGSLRQIRVAHQRRERLALSSVRPDVPRPLAETITRATDPDPANRFESTRDFEVALAAILAPHPAPPTHPRRWILAGIGAVAVAGLTTWMLSSRQPQPTLSNPSTGTLAVAAGAGTRAFRQVGGSDLAGPGAPSPDGRLLSMVDGGELAVHDVATGKRQRLTGQQSGDPPGWVEGSRFSLDGSRITYIRFVSQQDATATAVPEIRRISATGGKSRLLWRGTDDRSVNFYHWAGDDDLVLASRWPAEGRGELLLISTEDGIIRASHELPTAPSLTGGTLSPDGRFVAFEQTVRATGFRDIHIWDVAADSVTALVRDDANDGSPVWTPDGQHVLFMSNRSGGSGLWAQRVHNGVASDPPGRIDPSFGTAWPMGGLTNDGALFVRREIGTRDVFAVDIDPYTLVPEGPPKRVTDQPRSATGTSSWSTDSTQLAFFRRDGERVSLVVRSLQDGREREFRQPGMVWVARPRWEPGGRSILFKSIVDDAAGLSRLDVESGTITPVLKRAFNEYEVLPQPNVIVLAERAKRRIVLLDLHSGREQVIHRLEPPSSLVDMGISNRGDRLVFSSPFGGNKGGAVRVLDLAPPYRVREIFRTPAGSALWAYAWSVDDREVIIGRSIGANGEPDGKDHVWAVDVASGQARHIGIEIDRGLQHLRSSPDGRHLSFDAGFPYQEVWVLENAASSLPR